MPLVGFAVCAIAVTVVGILIGIVDVLAVAGVASANKVGDAMRPRVIRVHADSVCGMPLNGEHKAVIILRAPGRELAEPSNLILESRIQKAQLAPILSICERGARCSRSYLVIGGFTVQETITVGVAVARNVDRVVKRF